MRKVVGIGEILWDLLPAGRQLGGAPANFAYHASALGAESHVISRVGNDALGREVVSRLETLGLPVDTIQVDRSIPTGTVSVTVDAQGQPQYVIHEDVAWDHLAFESGAERAVRQADAICFGSLAQRQEPSRTTIRALVRASRHNALRIFDINLRQQYYSREIIEESLALANVLKVNETELPRLAELLDLRGDERSQVIELSKRYSLQTVAYTRGERGSLLYSRGSWSDHAGVSTKVVDTIGAGDSFTAAMALGLLAGWDLQRINDLANQVAAYVASSAGATPPIPEHLKSRFRPGEQPETTT